VDPLTEAAFSQLDQSEQQEFGDLKDQIHKAKKAGQVAKWKKDLAEKKAKLRKRVKFALGKKKAKAKVLPKTKAASPPISTAATSPDAVPQRSSGSTRARDPDTFTWGIRKCNFEFLRRTNPSGWQVKCCIHDAQEAVHPRASSLNPSELPCTRTMSVDALRNALPDLSSAEVDSVLVRQLKYWAVSGDCVSERCDHMDVKLFQRYVPLGNLPDDAALERQLVQLAKKPRFV
jgi:hypothetical protein